LVGCAIVGRKSPIYNQDKLVKTIMDRIREEQRKEEQKKKRLHRNGIGRLSRKDEVKAIDPRLFCCQEPPKPPNK